jgi:hypothetical protein
MAFNILSVEIPGLYWYNKNRYLPEKKKALNLAQSEESMVRSGEKSSFQELIRDFKNLIARQAFSGYNLILSLIL